MSELLSRSVYVIYKSRTTVSEACILHKDIFSLIYHTNGGFIHSDVYFMPVYLRRFYLNELIQARESENKSMEKSNKKS